MFDYVAECCALDGLMLLNVVLIVGAFTGFAVLHSLTAGTRLKDALARRLGVRVAEGWYRLAYNAASVILILPALAVGAMLPDRTLYRVELPWNLLMLGVQGAGAIGILVSLLSTDVLRFAGVTQALDYLAGRTSISSGVPLRIDGVYRIVRHPLYLFSMLVLWPLPVMTFNLLVFNVAATLYFGIGSLIEERRLERVYGDAYRNYRREVPWLIPLPRFR
jgi:protein-S-isoprenylcysteine O-methyltransferase Ste14